MKQIDERVLTIKKDINSKAFSITYFALWALIAYRMFILNQDPKEYNDLFILTIGISVFVILNTVLSGVYGQEKVINKKKRVVAEIGFLAVFMFFFYFITGVDSIAKLSLVAGMMIVIRFAPFLLGMLSSALIEKKLND